MKKLKLNIAMLAMVLGVTAAFAFKPSTRVNTKFAERYWFYNSASTVEAQFKVAGNYSTTNNAEGCISSGERPCKILVDADNTTQLQSILTPMAPDDVLDISEGRKN